MRSIWLRRQPHYAWVVLASVMMVFMVSTGMRFSFGVLIDPLVEEHGWSRGGISLAYTLQFLVGIPAVLIIGRLAEKISSRWLVMVGAVIFTIGMLLTAAVTRLWQFQLYFGILTGGLGAAPFTIILPVLLSRWFYRKLGVAIGLMWASLSLGPAALSPLMRWYIEAAGWSQTFIVFGFIGGLLMLVSGFFLRDDPREMKLVPYGGLPPDPYPQNISSADMGVKLNQIARTRTFSVLIAVHGLGCIGHSLLLAHMVSIATFAGIPSMAAAGILSLAVASSTISRFAMSLVSEWKGARFTLSSATLLQSLPPLLLLGASNLWVFYSFAFLFGLGYGGEMVGFPIFNRQYYGVNAPLSSIYSYQMAGAMLGMAVGGWLGGALFDWTGIYTWSILASAGASFLGVVASLVLPLHKR